MPRQQFQSLAALMILLALWGVPRAALAQGPGGSDGESPAGESKPAPKPSRTRQKVTLKLPEEYRSKDKDKDGQIGMYEWSRADFAGFRKLDLNGDGFLTPSELSRAGRSRRSAPAEVSSSSGSGSSAGGSSSGSNRESSTDGAAAVTVTAPADAASDAPVVNRSEAERQFDLVDKDKDGKVTEAEFQKSTMTRIKFKNAGISLSFPASRAEFLQAYPAK